MKKHRILALLLCGAIAFGLAGCKQDNDTPVDPTQPAVTDGPEKPDNFVDNSDGLDEIPDEQKYDIDGQAGLVLGVRDERVFLGGDGFATRFATNLLSADPDSDGSKGLPLAWIWDRIDYFRFGDKTYAPAEIVRPRDEGFQVLEKLAADFGVIVYSTDPETGMLAGAEHKGALAGDELREAYSERQDKDDCTICVYYLDARMSGLETAEYDKARESLKAAYGTDSGEALDGTLAVMLYYDTEGYDMYYNIAAIAPGYFRDADDFSKNMDANAAHDITNCHMSVDGNTAIGFVNQVFIRCDSDTVPDHTIVPETDDGHGSRVEEGAPEGADVSPTGSSNADKPGDPQPVPQDGSQAAPDEAVSDAPDSDPAQAGGRNTAGAQGGN